MVYRSLADAVVIFHFAVVVFVIAGGLLVVKWPRVAWVHLPVIAWVIFAEWFDKICPLTFLENWLRDKAGVGSYHDSFVGHYIMPILYPDGLTHQMQMWLGTAILLINVTMYGIVVLRHRRAQHAQPADPEHAPI